MSTETVEESDWSPDDEILMLRRKRHKAPNVMEGLNLTAMMDMMTIILVFLIKQFASAPENIQVSEVMMPPKSSTNVTLQPAVMVFISQDEIVVDNKALVKLKGGKIVSDDPANALAPVLERLNQKRLIAEELHKRGGPEFDGTLMVVADENTTYDLLSGVLLQAGRAKYGTYRMITRMK